MSSKLHYCLGTSIEQDKQHKCLWMHQKQYIQNLFKKYGLSKAKTVSTPADISVKLKKDDDFIKEVNPVTYISRYIVGSLLYTAIAI